jgi:hypothetical protein
VTERAKERGFKQDFKEEFRRTARSKALKNQDREKKQLGLGISTQMSNTPDPNFLSVCLSILCLFWVSSLPQLSPVRSSNNQGMREKTSLQQGREHEKQRPYLSMTSNKFEFIIEPASVRFS